MDAPPPSPDPSDLDLLRSLTRLLVGGTEMGIQELIQRLAQWENEIAAQRRLAEQVRSAEINPVELKSVPPPPETNSDLLRYALVGLIFNLEDRTRRNLSLARRAAGYGARLVSPLLKPLRHARLIPGYTQNSQRFEDLVTRGRSEIDRWISTGRMEEEHSRLLAAAAFDKTIDFYIEYLTHNPEVQDLVQSQSTGLANEVIEEVRERTVSADTFLEGMVRSLLRRTPRAHLPEPPPEVRTSAASIRASRKGRP